MKEFMRYVFPGGCLGLLIVTVLVSLAMGVMVEDYKKQIDNISSERNYWHSQYEVLAEDCCRLQGAGCDR